MAAKARKSRSADTPTHERTLMLRLISGNSALRDVSASTLEAFVGEAQAMHARRGAEIYQAGDDWERLGLVLEGTLAMLASEGGERAHLYERIGPGGFFGVSSIFDGEPEMAHTIVLSRDAAYAWFPREAVLRLCRRDPSLALGLATIIARRLRTVTALLAEQVNLSTRERLARFLLNFAEGTGMRSSSEPLSAMTQTQIAAATGTTKEVVARLIGEFEEDEALRRERGHIRYLNRQRLIRLAAGSNYQTPR
jgi:CRP-like cAMP-binding protein